MRLSRIAASLIIGIPLTALLYHKSRPYQPPPVDLSALASYIRKTGEPDTMPGVAAEFFGLGSGDIQFVKRSMKSEKGAVRAAQVRPIDGGFDIVFIHQDADGAAATFYLTSQTGELRRSCWYGAAPILLKDAGMPFEHERSFWLQWLSESRRLSGDN